MHKSFLFLPLLGLVACDGPWNTMPADYVEPAPSLRVSLFVVGGRTFDTLWLERTQPLAVDYDSTRAFVESADIRIVAADDGSEVVRYAPAAGSAVAWVPQSPVTALAGKGYRLTARVVWNADKNWPRGKTIDTTELEAFAKVPASWSVDQIAQVPVENLIPALAAGGSLADTTLLDSLERQHPGAVAKWRLTSDALDSLRKDIPVFRPLPSGDSIWYIYDDKNVVTNPDGKRVERAYRNLLFRQRPGPDFGGVFTVGRFDPNGARLEDPISRAFRTTTGNLDFGQEDSARFYQPGDTRYAFGPYPAFAPDIFGWPAIYPFSNLTLAYTGRNTIYFYSVEQQYVVYQSQLSRQAQGDPTALPYSNVKNAKGYFTAALVDSFVIHLRATPGVRAFSVPALRETACRRAWKEHLEDTSKGFDSLATCKGVDFRAGSK